MSFRSTQIFVHNETNEELNLHTADVTEGVWGHDGGQAPPSFIARGATGEIGTDSNGVGTGCEGNLRYWIGAPGGEEVYLHWVNPAVGHNGYNQHIGPSYDVIRRGGGGNNAVVEFHIRPSVLRTSGFVPSRDGFHFSNHWDDAPYTLPPLAGTILDQKYGNAANGLCGGMVFAARDYFEAAQAIPDVPRPPAGEQDPLFRYLVDRLFDTFGVDAVSLLLKLMNPLYPDTDENPLSALGLASGRASVMADIEWPAIRDDIDGGHPSPVCLITVRSTLPWDLGKCHQVLAYAYQVRGEDVELRVYDPNSVDAGTGRAADDIVLKFSIRTVAEPIVVSHNVDVKDDDGGRRPVYCFVRMNYDPRPPAVPTQPRPPANVPQQVWLTTEQVDLQAAVVEQGRKVFPVLQGQCGEAEFDYQILSKHQRVTVTAHTTGFVDPLITWRLANADVPAGAERTWTARVTPTGVDAAEWAEVTLKTTVFGNVLMIENLPEDGDYDFPVQVAVTEAGSGTPVRTTVAEGFTGSAFSCPDLADASARCMIKQLDELRQEQPTEAEMVAALMASLGHPPDPLWDPDPLLLHQDWETLSTENRQATLVPEDLRVVVTAGRAVATIDSGAAEAITEAGARGFGLDGSKILARANLRQPPTAPEVPSE